MSGEELRPFLNHLDVSYASVARKLGLSGQGLNNLLRTQDIKTGVLEKLSKAYDIPVSFFYEGETEKAGIRVQAIGSSAASVNGNATVKVDSELAKEKIRYLEAIIIEKNERLREQNERLKEQNERIHELKECLELVKSHN